MTDSFMFLELLERISAPGKNDFFYLYILLIIT